MINLTNPNNFLNSLEKDDLLKIWKKIVITREFENQVRERYSKKLMKTPVHLGVGQEAIATGVLESKMIGDQIYAHHRSHNPYLASGGSVKKLALELHGKAGGCSGGKGGSVHVVDLESGFVGSSAILGQAVSVATGASLGFKLSSSKNCVFVFFGDAALEEGVIWECLNFAGLFNLPIFYICENNSLSTESNLVNRKASNTSFTERARAFGIHSEQVFGQNVFEVMSKVQELSEYVRFQQKPVFLECLTYRFLEHVGPDFDYEKDRSFRGKKEQKINEVFDPVKICEEALVSAFGIGRDELHLIRKTIQKQIAETFDEAENAEFPIASEIGTDVY